MSNMMKMRPGKGTENKGRAPCQVNPLCWGDI